VSNTPQGPGWWQASDGRWYEPHLHPQYRPPPPPNPNYMAGTFYGALPQGAYPQPGAIGPSRFCVSCGAPVFPTAAICTQCGTMLGTPKDKTVAVLLAVFLAPWNWLYTYKRDAAKFWVGLFLWIFGWILVLVFVGLIILFGLWLWAVIDSAIKPDSYYRQFPNG
jgi:predicted nucleic acid-binding Zn ribbon protein